LDWYPWREGFRFSGGLFYNDNRVDGLARSTSGFYDLAGTHYMVDQVGDLSGAADFRRIAPYLGVGWGSAFAGNGRLGFTFDLGVMFQGTPDVALSASGPARSDESFQQDLRMEQQALRQELDSLQYYPIFSMGLNYTF
jgi:hypothetical protein